MKAHAHAVRDMDLAAAVRAATRESLAARGLAAPDAAGVALRPQATKLDLTAARERLSHLGIDACMAAPVFQPDLVGATDIGSIRLEIFNLLARENGLAARIAANLASVFPDLITCVVFELGLIEPEWYLNVTLDMLTAQADRAELAGDWVGLQDLAVAIDTLVRNGADPGRTHDNLRRQARLDVRLGRLDAARRALGRVEAERSGRQILRSGLELEITSVQRAPHAAVRLDESLSQQGWPNLMSRTNFERLSPDYDSRVVSATFDDAELFSDAPGWSFFQFPLIERRHLLVDEYNIHPFHYFGRPGSPLVGVWGAQALADNMGAGGSVRVRGRSCLLGGAPNFYHWLIEYLPRLGAADDLDSYDNVVVNAQLAPFQAEWLAFLSGRKPRLVSASMSELMRFDRIDCPTIRPIPEAAAFLSRFARLDPTAGRRLFISRADAAPHRRRIRDEERLFQDALKPLGFERVVLGYLNAEETVELFGRASVVVAAHGAGLTNIVFCKPGALVVELCNATNATFDFFRVIADSMGHRHARVVGAPIGEAALFEDLEIAFDPARLKLDMSRLMDGQAARQASDTEDGFWR